MNTKLILITGVLLIALTILLDAFGAHGLKQIVAPESIATYGIGTKYLGITGIAFCLLHFILNKYPIHSKAIIVLWSLGTLFFSGSIFLLTFKSTLPSAIISVAGPITPIGGTLIIAGWVLLALRLNLWKK